MCRGLYQSSVGLTLDRQGVVSFTLEELKGVPADVISGYTKRTKDGKEVYDVTFKTPDIFPLVCYLPIPISSLNELTR